MSRRSLELIEAMYAAAEAAQPITGRGLGYKLFAQGLVSSMDEMQAVYRLLRIAREQGDIPWEWVVDETRELEKVATWKNPAAYARTVARSYRRDFWNQQPHRVEVWSEKGTIRGVLQPVLDKYAVGLTGEHVLDLPSFPASNKRKDPRFNWFTERFGERCWELDAMDPRDLRDCVEEAIKELIEPKAWRRCEIVNKAEQKSLKTVIGNWGRQ